jgi:hypothetical protein
MKQANHKILLSFLKKSLLTNGYSQPGEAKKHVMSFNLKCKILLQLHDSLVFCEDYNASLSL